MTQQTVNVGAVAGDGNGDKGQVPFTKANSNFTELYSKAFLFGIDSGAANAYVVALASLVPTPAVAPALAAGLLVRFTPTHVGTGPATLNFAGTGAVAIQTLGGAALLGGEIQLVPMIFQYSGTAWQIIYPTQATIVGYGADPTGTNDSLAAFNVAAAANTDYVSIPPGTYKLSANTNPGLWNVAAGATFTGAGIITGKTIQRIGSTGNYIQRLIGNFETSPSQFIAFNIEQGLYQPGTVSALQFGQATELFTPSASTAIWNGQLNAVYGSVSHFGSGAVNFQVGGAFESFNDGSATVVAGVGVNGNAWNGGVAAGNPVQTPTNNGIVQNLRGVSGFCGNLSTGTVTTASSLFASTINNTGGGAITNAVGLTVGDQTAGTNNFAILTGLGLNQFGAAVRIAGRTNLPANTGAAFYLAQGTLSGGSAGRIYVGDGSGWNLEFVARTASVDTVIGTMSDAGSLSLKSGLGVNGAAVPSQVTGFGTPVGAAVVANYNSGSSTSLQDKQSIAQILAVLKAAGLIGN